MLKKETAKISILVIERSGKARIKINAKNGVKNIT
jgi:hypothetical protein